VSTSAGARWWKMDCRLQNNKLRFHPTRLLFLIFFALQHGRKKRKRERGVRALRFAFFIEFLHEADPEEWYLRMRRQAASKIHALESVREEFQSCLQVNLPKILLGNGIARRVEF
jgi:hypothetical protein